MAGNSRTYTKPPLIPGSKTGNKRRINFFYKNKTFTTLKAAPRQSSENYQHMTHNRKDNHVHLTTLINQGKHVGAQRQSSNPPSPPQSILLRTKLRGGKHESFAAKRAWLRSQEPSQQHQRSRKNALSFSLRPKNAHARPPPRRRYHRPLSRSALSLIS